jgi:hypothetical protein
MADSPPLLLDEAATDPASAVSGFQAVIGCTIYFTDIRVVLRSAGRTATAIMSRRRGHSGTIVAAGGVMLIALVLWLTLIARSHVAPVNDFQVADDRTLAIDVIGGPWALCGASATETSIDVRIAASCLEPLGRLPQEAVGMRHQVSVRLATPLGDRSVTDDWSDLPVVRR